MPFRTSYCSIPNAKTPIGENGSANEIAAETWLQQNDPEGVAFEYEVLE